MAWRTVKDSLIGSFSQSQGKWGRKKVYNFKAVGVHTTVVTGYLLNPPVHILEAYY